MAHRLRSTILKIAFRLSYTFSVERLDTNIRPRYLCNDVTFLRMISATSIFIDSSPDIDFWNIITIFLLYFIPYKRKQELQIVRSEIYRNFSDEEPTQRITWCSHFIMLVMLHRLSIVNSVSFEIITLTILYKLL